MAVSNVSVVHRAGSRDAGDVQQVVADVTLSGSYTASGEAVAAATLGLSRLLGAQIIGDPANAYHWVWDQTNGRLRAYRTGPATAGVLQEAPGATNTAGTLRVLFYGVV